MLRGLAGRCDGEDRESSMQITQSTRPSRTTRRPAWTGRLRYRSSLLTNRKTRRFFQCRYSRWAGSSIFRFMQLVLRRRDLTHRMAVVTFIAVSLAFCGSCRGDDDGSFCQYRGYLAYELRSGITPGVAGHVLKIVRFEPKRGIYNAGEVTLQDFQVHRMTCGQDRVEISGWGKIFKKYIIDIAGQEKRKVVDYTESPTRRFDASKDGPEAPKFAYAHPGALELESLDPDD